VLQGTKDERTETGRCCAVEMNVERTKEITIPTQPSPIQVTIGCKQTENVEYLNYFGCMIKNNARCAHEIKSRVVTKQQHSTRKELFSPANWN
jgi:hypothetical protein